MQDNDGQQALERLARQGSAEIQETSTVTSPGARAGAWAVQVKSHVSYNVYNVVAVVIGPPGTGTLEIGQQVQAVNLAEPFLQEGTLSAGVHAVMFKIGDKNVFYAVP